MPLPTLSADGLVDRPPELFIEAIEFNLEHWIHELSSEDWSLRIGAGHLAAEVYASGLQWSPVACRFRDAAVIKGMNIHEADRLLDLAWQVAPYRSAAWIRFTREWISVEDTDCFYQIKTGLSVSRDDFCDLFSDAIYDAELVAVFPEYLATVKRINCDPSAPRGFHMLDDDLVFNAP